MPKSYTTYDVRISLAEMRLWGLLIIGSAYWGNVIRSGWDPNAHLLLGIAQSITGNSAFAAGAWIVIILLALESMPSACSSGRMSAVTIAACLPAIFPSEQTTMLSMLGLGAQSFVSRETHNGRAIALLMFALAGNVFWTSFYLLPMHATVGLFDARIVQVLLRIKGANADGFANLVTNESGKFSLEILAQCASSFPLAGVCLAFTVTLSYLRKDLSRRHIGWLMASLLGSVALTEVRLLWMASSESDYVWLHDGGGRILYSLAAVLLATLFPLLAARVGQARATDGQLSGSHHPPGRGGTGHSHPGCAFPRERRAARG